MPAIRCSSTARRETARRSSRRRFARSSTVTWRYRTHSKSRATSSASSIPSITRWSTRMRDDHGITAESTHDRRWLRCRRPMVMVGGELTLASLELSYSSTTGFYRAPVQAVANGGVLVIDDFGRQTCSPRDLLNRWIVPLESRVDFLTLQTGQKFELPFMTLIVFATNIRPAELVDEAFLRRIQYKIFAESPTIDDFTRIFQNNCRDLGATFEAGPDRTPALRLLPSAQDRAPRLPSARPDQAGAVAGLLSRPAAAPHTRPPRRRLQQLLRRRPGRTGGLRLTRWPSW